LKDPSTGLVYTNNQIPTSQFNSSALGLFKYIPLATASTGKLVYGLPLPQNEDQYIARIDWTATTKQTVSAATTHALHAARYLRRQFVEYTESVA